MKSRGALAVGLAMSLALALAGCGDDDAPGDDGSSGGTLTVWLMNGSAPDELVQQINAEFEQAHPGWTVDYQVQQWNGIQDKLTTALASNDPPDVIELGNTQAPKFAAAGALAELDAAKASLGGDHWLEGLAATGVWDGTTYATPFYGANRIVIYRTDLFAEAGIEAVPQSLAELLDAGERLQEASDDPEFQALYLPGQSWYTLLSFIWAQGGDVATNTGGTWQGALHTPQAQAGFEDYATLFHALSKAPPDADEATPQQSTVFAQGKVGMFIGLPWEIGTATAEDGGNPELADSIGTFPIPGPQGPAPVFLGGSNLAVAAGSPNAAQATDWLALMLSEKYQTQLAANGVVPAITTLGEDVYGDNEAAKVMAAAAASGGKVTPPDPAWAAVEAGTNPIKDAMTAMLRGTPVAEATQQASDAITERMAGAAG